MNCAFKDTIFRFLIIALMMLPFQIGAVQVNSAAAAQVDHNVVVTFVGRSQTVNQFKTQGLDTEAARDRVATMSDAEVNTLAGRIDAATAVGNGLVLLVLAGFFIWYFIFRR